MKLKNFSFAILFISVFAYSQDKIQPEQNGSLRIDFMLAGSADKPQAFVVDYYHEPYFSGNPDQNIRTDDYGQFRVDVIDQDGKLIYRNSFCSLFEEWLDTDLKAHGPRAFEESVNIPFPDDKISVSFFMRQKSGVFVKVSTWDIHPDNPNIKPSSGDGVNYVLIHGTEDYSKSLDFAILTEGYTNEDMEKSVADGKRFVNALLSTKPFDEFKDQINIWLVQKESSEQGTDNPRKGIWKETAFNSSFNTLQLDRYLSVSDYFLLKDAAAAVPYDLILVMVNTEMYGGGGIYNHFSVFSSNGPVAEKVFLHELGHHFAGLADEYYNSEVSYTEGIDLSIEPWQPNVTTLVDFERKWKNMVDENTPIPTPREEKYKNVVGAFEGAIYLNKGAYSPAMDCRMKSNEAEGFCPVCQEAIRAMILNYVK